MAQALLLLITVYIGLFALSACYPTGAPQETCKIFTANHSDHLPQTAAAKYVFKLDPSTVSSGEKAIVTIQGIGGETFRGFFIQGQDEITKKPIGKFTPESGVSQTRDCVKPGSADASTHVERSDKTEVSLEWEAPPTYKGNVVFAAVIVKTYKVFWDDLTSSPITVV